MQTFEDRAFVRSLGVRTWDVDFEAGGDSSNPDQMDSRHPADFDLANAYSSRSTLDNTHKILLDIDQHEVRLMPSSTPGHYHLVIDAAVEWQDYLDLLHVLERMGVVQPGYVELAEKRGQAFLRLPGVAKEA